MDISKMQDCKPKNTIKFIKFSKDLIEGYDCLATGCERFDVDCKECDWNTKTPYLTIEGTKFYITAPIAGRGNTTTFGVEECFYILIETIGDKTSPTIKTTIRFLSEEAFKSSFTIV